MSNNFITLAQAKDMTKRYRENLDALVSSDYAGALPYSETFDAAVIQAVLNQAGCVSFRCYFGMKENKEVCAIFVGVDAEGKDILSTNLKLGVKDGEDIIVEFGARCPPDCNGTNL
jgi:hypothetical protein